MVLTIKTENEEVTHLLDLTEQPFVKKPVIMAIAALIFALVSMSAAALFIRFSEGEIAPSATAFNRFWITTVVLGLWKGFSGLRKSRLSTEKPVQQEPYSGWVWGDLLAVGIFGSADLILWAWSLTQTSVANATLLANLTPLFTTFGAWLVLKKRFDSRYIAGMVVAIAGAIALGLEDFSYANGKLLGDFTALGAAISFGIYLLVLERLQTKLNITSIVFWSSAIATILTLPLVLTTSQKVFPSSWQGWLAVISLSLICQILGQGLLVYSLKRLSSQFIALFLLLDPVLAALGAGAFLSEKLDILNWIGLAIIMLGMYLALSSKSAEKEAVD